MRPREREKRSKRGTTWKSISLVSSSKKKNKREKGKEKEKRYTKEKEEGWGPNAAMWANVSRDGTR